MKRTAGLPAAASTAGKGRNIRQILNAKADGGFAVTLLCSMEGRADCSGSVLERLAQTAALLLDPARKAALPPRLLAKVEEARSLVRDGFPLRVRMLLLSRGGELERSETDRKRLEEALQTKVREAGLNRCGPDVQEVEARCFTPHDLIALRRPRQKLDGVTLQLVGKMLVEDQNFKRVLIGRIHVRKIAALCRTHGDLFLENGGCGPRALFGGREEKTVRRMLTTQPADWFYFLTGGVTLLCRRFNYNALQATDHAVIIGGLRVAGGGSLCRAVCRVLQDLPEEAVPDASLKLRVYAVDADEDGGGAFARGLAHVAEGRNPLEADLPQADDGRWMRLEEGARALGSTFRREGGSGGSFRSLETDSTIITPRTVAAAVLSVWRRRPHQGRFLRRWSSRELNDLIFRDLNAAQALLAVRILRDVEMRVRSEGADAPVLLSYAPHWFAMLMGAAMLNEAGLTIDEVDERSFRELEAAYAESSGAWYRARWSACRRP